MPQTPQTITVDVLPIIRLAENEPLVETGWGGIYAQTCGLCGQDIWRSDLGEGEHAASCLWRRARELMGKGS